MRTALVVAVDPDEARSKGHIASVVPMVRRFRRAILLSPEMSDGTLVSVTVPMNTLEPLSGPGRGLLCTPGAVQVIQAVQVVQEVSAQVGESTASAAPSGEGETP